MSTSTRAQKAWDGVPPLSAMRPCSPTVRQLSTPRAGSDPNIDKAASAGLLAADSHDALFTSHICPGGLWFAPKISAGASVGGGGAGRVYQRPRAKTAPASLEQRCLG